MSKKSKAGYCAHYFVHRGIGRTVEETKDMAKKKQELMRPGSDALFVTCGPDKKKVIKQYNDKIEKDKQTKRLKRLNGKSKKNKSYKPKKGVRTSGRIRPILRRRRR